MNELLKRFMDSPEDHGLPGMLPSGKYPFEVVKAEGAKTSKETSVRVKLQLKVLDGPYKDQSAFPDHYLPNLLDEEQYEKEDNKYLYGAATLCNKVMGAPPHAEPLDHPTHYDSVIDAVVAAYDVERWVGKRFIGDIMLDTVQSQVKKLERQQAQGEQLEADPSAIRDRNRLTGWHEWDDKKEGYENWKKKVLPKQEIQARGTAKPKDEPKHQSSTPSVM